MFDFQANNNLAYFFLLIEFEIGATINIIQHLYLVSFIHIILLDQVGKNIKFLKKILLNLKHKRKKYE